MSFGFVLFMLYFEKTWFLPALNERTQGTPRGVHIWFGRRESSALSCSRLCPPRIVRFESHCHCRRSLNVTKCRLLWRHDGHDLLRSYDQTHTHTHHITHAVVGLVDMFLWFWRGGSVTCACLDACLNELRRELSVPDVDARLIIWNNFTWLHAIRFDWSSATGWSVDGCQMWRLLSNVYCICEVRTVFQCNCMRHSIERRSSSVATPRIVISQRMDDVRWIVCSLISRLNLKG